MGIPSSNRIFLGAPDIKDPHLARKISLCLGLTFESTRNRLLENPKASIHLKNKNRGLRKRHRFTVHLQAFARKAFKFSLGFNEVLVKDP